MDINLLRGIATVVVMVCFLGICWWAYIYRSKESFKQAANLPFADDQNSFGDLQREESQRGETK